MRTIDISADKTINTFESKLFITKNKKKIR